MRFWIDRKKLMVMEILQGVDGEEEKVEVEQCEGVGEEECLMRRTLEAHLDYIYTQEKKP